MSEAQTRLSELQKAFATECTKLGDLHFRKKVVQRDIDEVSKAIFEIEHQAKVLNSIINNVSPVVAETAPNEVENVEKINE